MATRAEVLEVLVMLGAQLHLEIAESTASVWCEIFVEVNGEMLQSAVRMYLKKTRSRKLPMPGQIIAMVQKLEEKERSAGLSSFNCDDCDNLGLVRRRRPHPKEPKLTISVMRPCSCPLGRAKEDYLKREKRAGRADNKVLVGR